jgi:hypothetical protein
MGQDHIDPAARQHADGINLTHAQTTTLSLMRVYGSAARTTSASAIGDCPNVNAFTSTSVNVQPPSIMTPTVGRTGATCCTRVTSSLTARRDTAFVCAGSVASSWGLHRGIAGVLQ